MTTYSEQFLENEERGHEIEERVERERRYCDLHTIYPHLKGTSENIAELQQMMIEDEVAWHEAEIERLKDGSTASRQQAD